MEEIIKYFPLVLYILGATLLVILIILSLKLIKTIDKTNEILEDTYNKTKSLDKVFNTIDKITDSLNTISDSIVSTALQAIGRIFKSKKKKKIDSEDDIYE